VADQVGIPMERVQVVHGDTLAVPTGQGTGGSRTLVVGGSSIFGAAQKVREKLLKIAAHSLEAPERDLELFEQKVQVKGVPAKAISIDALAKMAHDPDALPEGVEPGLEEQSTFNVKHETYPFGAHLCMLEVDPETGHIKILRYISVDDCGTIMNPLLVEGQVHGGIAQGIGQALYEGVVFDSFGQNLTGTLMDYALPKAEYFPPFELHRTITPSPTNPLGAKGVGEAGTIGSTPAVANAVVDALAPLGIRHLDMPFLPQKMWQVFSK
jgi:aerobic carbon-monoxide dehydrogenase large subunit